MCGVVGVLGRSGAAARLYDGLCMLQHRGQEAAGMATMVERKLFWHKGHGMVSSVFDPSLLATLPGGVGIAHVRYATSGAALLSESQPLYVNSPCGLMLAHNGNLTNVEQLSALSLLAQRHINTNSDTELLLNVLAEGMQRAASGDQVEDLFAGVRAVNQHCQGAYSCVALLAGLGLLAFRDPYGVRPLVLGQHDLDGSYMVASESVALDLAGFRLLRDIQPGEALLLRQGRAPLSRICSELPSPRPCLFEYVYFARPDSLINGASVYHCRMNAGRLLGEEIRRRWSGLPIEVVVPIPEMGRVAALEVAQVLGVPLREGFVKNRYVGRTFIMSQQQERAFGVRRKFNPIASDFADKHVLLVDDSLVRGTTSAKIVEMVRRLGARSVRFALAAPQVRFPNVYGMDIPTRRELVAHGRSDEQISQFIGADGVIFLPLEALQQAVQEAGSHLAQFEDSIFTGRYLCPQVDEDFLLRLEQRQEQRQRVALSTDNLMING